jgi:radical SAM superfamily enzyme YgiQ (UPF0313 family)
MWITAEKLVRHDIAATINVIVGFPGETAESIAETLRVARRLRAMTPSFELSIFYFKPYPGNPIADELRREGYAFPETLEAWAAFDYVGNASPWLTPAQCDEIEHFKFYQRLAYGPARPMRWPIQCLARWRVERGDYRVPIERKIIEWLRPPQPLS